MPSDPPPQTLHTANDLRRAITRLARRLRRLRADHGVSAAKLSILGLLHRAGAPVTAGDLARQENLQPQSLTRILAELNEAGLIARRQDETDRRQTLIELTAPGSALLAQDAARQTAWLTAAIDGSLTGMEQGLLSLSIPLLNRLAEAQTPTPPSADTEME
jgi:DNA-binding MarR family transcriptional regulator